MLLKNALVLDDSFCLKSIDIEIKGERIACRSETSNEDQLDLSGMYLIPGLIDTHIHGANGAEVDTGTDTSLNTVSEFEARHGITTFAPTIQALALSDMLQAIKAVRSIHNVRGAKIGGIHLEGPFVSEAYKGALLAEYIHIPDIEVLKSLVKASEGMVKLITLAPELEGAGELIQYAVLKGITVSMGHSNATYEQVLKAIEQGAAQTTHTFNAMRPLNHREPGILGAALTNDKVKCELICDFLHVHSAIVNMVFKLKGEDGINLISDSCSAAGLGDGEYWVNGQKYIVKDGAIRTLAGTIAGSTKTLMDGVRNLIRIGIPFESVIKAASLNPAKTLGIDGDTGSILPGKYADLVALDKDLNVLYTFINGKCIYKA